MSGYIPSVPTANQTISQTQSPINTNFTVINTAFGIDHVAMTDITNQGDHKQVTLVSIQPPNGDPTAVSQGPIFYSKQVTYPGAIKKNELFFEQATGDGSAVVQLTNMFSSVLNASSGSTFLPGGLIIKWGTTSGSGNVTKTFASLGLSNFPNTCFMVIAQPINGGAPTSDGGYVYTSSPSASQFSFLAVRRTTLVATSVTFSFIAIGN